jgi:hypothetical protein
MTDSFAINGGQGRLDEEAVLWDEFDLFHDVP